MNLDQVPERQQVEKTQVWGSLQLLFTRSQGEEHMIGAELNGYMWLHLTVVCWIWTPTLFCQVNGMRSYLPHWGSSAGSCPLWSTHSGRQGLRRGKHLSDQSDTCRAAHADMYKHCSDQRWLINSSVKRKSLGFVLFCFIKKKSYTKSLPDPNLNALCADWCTTDRT